MNRTINSMDRCSTRLGLAWSTPFQVAWTINHFDYYWNYAHCELARARAAMFEFILAVRETSWIIHKSCPFSSHCLPPFFCVFCFSIEIYLNSNENKNTRKWCVFRADLLNHPIALYLSTSSFLKVKDVLVNNWAPFKQDLI